MKNLSSLHHSFDIALATHYGITEAILIHHFQYWVAINKRKGKNSHDGRTWTYQTVDEIAIHFPYLSKEEIRGALHRLCTGIGRRSTKKDPDFAPVLLKGNFNLAKYDQTNWYAFVNNCFELNLPNIQESVDDIKENITEAENPLAVEQPQPRPSSEHMESSLVNMESSQQLGDLPASFGRSPRPIPNTKTYSSSPSPSNDVSLNAQHHSSGIPQPPQSAKNDDEDLKKAFGKSLKGDEVDRAVKYYKTHPDELSKAKNPIGFVVFAIRNNDDVKDAKRLEIIEQRKAWAAIHCSTATGGYRTATRDGYEVCSGSITSFYKYNGDNDFWEKQGLGFPIDH